MKWLVLVLLAACGDIGSKVPDAPPPPDAASQCTATFAGNFAETLAGDDACATLEGTSLKFSLPSQVMMARLIIAIELEEAQPGTYTPQTVALWNASATKIIGPGACYYMAGSESSPHGDFALDLTAAAPPHGHLHILQRVLARAFTSCGDVTSETVDLDF